MNRRLELLSIVLVALGAAVVGGITSSLADEAQVEVGIGELRGEILSLFAPPGVVARETNPNYKSAAAPAPAAPRSPAAADWPSYNKTLTSERFSDLSQINTKNVAKLKVLCTYDTWRLASFETGLIMVEGALIGTTEFDIFSIDPSTCAENWRTHEEYPAYILPTIGARPTSTACCSVGPRTGACWPMTSKPASGSGRPQSGTRKRAKTCRRRRSPGVAIGRKAPDRGGPRKTVRLCVLVWKCALPGVGHMFAAGAAWQKPFRAPRRAS